MVTEGVYQQPSRVVSWMIRVAAKGYDRGMHLLLAIALLCVPLGAVLLIVALAVGRRRPRARRRFLVAGASAAGLSVVIVSALARAEPTVCTMHGGDYNSGGCQDEVGGNGDNDPSNHSKDPWPWTTSTLEGDPWYSLD